MTYFYCAPLQVYTPFRSAQNHCPPDNVRPAGGYISWGLTPTTDTSLFLTTYRGGSHLPANIYADNQFMKNYLEQQNTFDEEAFIVADSAYSGEENSQIAALDFQKLLDYINSLNNCAPKIETA